MIISFVQFSINMFYKLKFAFPESQNNITYYDSLYRKNKENGI